VTRRSRILYSRSELRFIESRRAMSRRALHAAFVAAFGRGDVTLDHIKSLCSRKRWATGRKRWRARDDARLRELYPDISTAAIARRLGRTAASIYRRAEQLGLRKSAAYLASPAACRLRRGDNIGAACRFQKGHVPANKGLRRPGWAPCRMRETQFQKGHVTRRWKPIGSERLVEGYLYTKVTDHRGVPWTVNWKPTHVLRWQALHGRTVPQGMALKCLDGNKHNTDPSNWELVPRALLPRLNGRSGRAYDRAPAELKPTILALAKLEHAAGNRRRRTVEAAYQERAP
jgi:HNH endonuclease